MKRINPITAYWTPESILNKQGREAPKLHVFSDETSVFWLVLETPSVYFMTRVTKQLFDAFHNGARARCAAASLKNEMAADHFGWAVHHKRGNLWYTKIQDVLKVQSDKQSDTSGVEQGQDDDGEESSRPQPVPVQAINPNSCWCWRNRFGIPPADRTTFYHMNHKERNHV